MAEFSYNDLLKLMPKARPRKFPEPQCDPIFEHCIKLREFHNKVDNLVQSTAKLKKIYEDSEREPIIKSLPFIPELPEVVNKTPGEDQKCLELEEIDLSEDTVMKLVSKAVARIMFVLGYTDMPTHLMQMLSDIVVDYIKSLSVMLVEMMPEDGSVSVVLLETALQQKGMSGIKELHDFYTERVVKFHDKLYLKCKQLYEDLKNNLRKPDAPPKKHISKSYVEEQCPTDNIKEEQISEMDSEKNSFEQGALAEDLFLHRKLKCKNVPIASEIKIDDTSSCKDLYAEIAIDQEKSPIGSRKKRPRLMKHEKVSENDVCSENMSPRMKDNLKKSEQSHSSVDYNMDSDLQENLFDTISEKNYDSCYNPETNSKFDVCSSNKNDIEMDNEIPEASSSSENEHRWV